MKGLIGFLATTSGRMTRVAAGLLLIVVGLIVIGGTAGLVVAAIGLVPIAAGTADVCLFAPLGGLPFQGARIRARR